eukprot:GEMP01088555.1.p1 GENE.GEMP01088555.1~~GEMP01088555.1.p1  ORF type:complete len:147 (-),score=1.78 GEMP01088555.1:101-541(-)
MQRKYREITHFRICFVIFFALVNMMRRSRNRAFWRKKFEIAYFPHEFLNIVFGAYGSVVCSYIRSLQGPAKSLESSLVYLMSNYARKRGSARELLNHSLGFTQCGLEFDRGPGTIAENREVLYRTKKFGTEKQKVRFGQKYGSVEV